EASGVDDFLQRLPGSFHWPKPNAEAIAAAVEAVHRLSGNAAQDLAAAAEPDHSADACPACGRALPPGARFCLACGLPTHPGAGDAGTPARPTAASITITTTIITSFPTRPVPVVPLQAPLLLS